MRTIGRKRIRDSRTQFIVIFQDLKNITRYGGLLRAQSQDNAEFMARCINGIIIGEIDKENGEEFYYEDKVQELNKHTLDNTWLF